MKKPTYFSISSVVLALVLICAGGGEAGVVGQKVDTGGQEVSAGAISLLEPSQAQAGAPEVGAGQSGQVSTAETPERAPLPQSDVVIDRLSGEVNIGRDDVVRRAKLLTGELQIDGKVLDDVQMVAGQIEVRGEVGDRVELVAGEVAISGRVGAGGVNVKFGEVKVSGAVDGPVTVEFGNVSLRGDGAIHGDVTVRRGEFRGSSDRVKGSVTVNQRMTARRGWGWARPVIAFIGVMTLIGLAATILILALFFRTPIQKGAALMQKENLAWNLLWGGAAVLAFLPVFVMLCVTIIGIPLALLLPFLYAAAWLFGVILLANYLGDWILTDVIKGQSNFLVGTILGIIVLGISLAVPVFGPILMAVYTLLAIGLSFRLTFGYLQGRRRPPAPPQAAAPA